MTVGKSTACNLVKQLLNDQYCCLQYLTGCVFFLVAVGGTASGKSTVCDLAKQRLNNQCVVMPSVVSDEDCCLLVAIGGTVVGKSTACNLFNQRLNDQGQGLNLLSVVSHMLC